MDDFELAHALFGSDRASRATTVGATTTQTGTATSDSSGGRAMVAIDGLTVSGDQGASVEAGCVVSVKNGDRVTITTVNGRPTVTGVVGWGDGIQEQIDSAIKVSDSANAAATEAKNAATEASEASADALKLANEAVDAVGASYVWADSAGQVHVSTQGKPDSGDDDAGRHVLLTALGIALMSGGSKLAEMTGGSSGRVDLYDGAGKRRLSVTSAGVVMYDADGTTATATLAADSTLGKTAGKHIVLSSDNGISLLDGDTVLSSFTVSGAIIGQTSGMHIAVTSDGVQILNGSSVLANFDSDSINFAPATPTQAITFAGGHAKLVYYMLTERRGQLFLTCPEGVVLQASSTPTDSSGIGVTVSGTKKIAIMRADTVELSATTFIVAGVTIATANMAHLGNAAALGVTSGYLQGSSSSDSFVRYDARFGMCVVSFNWSVAQAVTITAGTLPSGVRPSQQVLATGIVSPSGTAVMLRVRPNGVVTAEYPATAGSGTAYVCGQVVFAYGSV